MTLRLAIAYLAYPVLVVGATGLALALAPLGEAIALGAPQALVLGSVFALERLIPFDRRWMRGPGEWRIDVMHAVLSTSVAAAIVHGLTDWPARAASQAIGSVWPTSWPLAIQILLALAIGELGNYWLHRIEHTTFLWPLHSLHHASPRVDALGVMRNHPLDVALTVAIASVPAALLGASPTVLLGLAALSSAHAPLQHCNIDLRLGPLKHVVNTAEVHRFHHARDVRDANGNYGAVLLLWDAVFGTHLRFGDRVVGEVGLPPDAPEEKMPEQYLAHVVWPFRRLRRSA